MRQPSPDCWNLAQAAFKERLTEEGDTAVDQARRRRRSSTTGRGAALLLWLNPDARVTDASASEQQLWAAWRQNELEWLGRGQYYAHHGYPTLAVRSMHAVPCVWWP